MGVVVETPSQRPCLCAAVMVRYETAERSSVHFDRAARAGERRAGGRHIRDKQRPYAKRAAT